MESVTLPHGQHAGGSNAPSRQTIIVAVGRIVLTAAHCWAAVKAKLALAPRPAAPRRHLSVHTSTPRVSAGRAFFIKLGTSSTAPTRTEISSPTRLQALMFEAARRPAARLKAGLRPSSCARRFGDPTRRCAALLESLGSSRCAESSSPLLKKTIEVQRRRRPSRARLHQRLSARDSRSGPSTATGGTGVRSRRPRGRVAARRSSL